MRITQQQRDKYALFDDGSYPIFNKKTAESAIKLRGRLDKANRLYLLEKAMKFAPEAAGKALTKDIKDKKVKV